MFLYYFHKISRLGTLGFKIYLLVSLFLSFNRPVMAQGNLLINPPRVIFEGKKHIEELSLANSGKDTAVYQISFLQLRMKEDGNFLEIQNPDSGQKFAEPYLRVFPRKVKLGPNEGQVIKLQFKGSSEMEPGEYRSHLYFRAVTTVKPLGEPEDPKSLSVRITPIFGISIPVIIRIGETHAQVNITSISLSDREDSTSILNMRFTRTGNKSVYGNILVNYLGSNGHKILVAEADGVAVYTPNTTRFFKIYLKKIRGINFHSGKIEITYQSNLAGKWLILAQTQYSF